jgi:GTP cyclohydrolase I
LNKELECENSIRHLLEYIGEDTRREGLLDTPKRVRKAYEFMTGGYALDPKEIINSALFQTTNDEMVIVKDIEFYSLCEHHLLPFFGKAHIAYIPDGKVVGLSKIPRIVNLFARRLQIQEQLTEEIAHTLMEHIQPKGVAVVINARHMCMEMRGVEKICSNTTTSAIRGIFRTNQKTKDEFFRLIK